MIQKTLTTKSLSLYILIMVNLLFIPFYSTIAQDSNGGILPALSTLEASVEEININAHVNLENLFLKPKEAETRAVEISKEFSLKDCTVENYSTLDNTQIVLQGINEDSHKVTVIVQATDIPEITETNIVVDILSQDPSTELTVLEENIRQLLEPLGSINLNTNITASYKGELSILEQKEIINNLMKKLRAKEVEVFTDENMVSVTGYTNQIKDWKEYGNKKVNLNIAMRYNSYEDKTNLWIGTPFITIGY